MLEMRIKKLSILPFIMGIGSWSAQIFGQLPPCCCTFPHVTDRCIGLSPEGSVPAPPCPPLTNDRTFVTDFGTGSEYCGKRTPAPPEFQEKIGVLRYVNKTNAEECAAPLPNNCDSDADPGTLFDVTYLTDNDLVGKRARLTIAAWDVDGRNGCAGRERDRVYFNDVPVGYLSGGHERWSITSIRVPIRLVRFPDRGTAGGYQGLRANRISIDVDVTQQCWCTTIAWMALEIRAMSPVVLLHGSGQSHTFWDNPVVKFKDPLKNQRIVFDSGSDHETQTVQRSADAIADHLNILMNRDFGVDSVHLVAHSKGGLDSIYYMQNLHLPDPPPPPEGEFPDPSTVRVLSLTTVGSPLRGNGAMDAIVLYAEYARFRAFFKGFPANFYFNLAAPIYSILIGPAPNLTTGAATTQVIGAIDNLKDSRVKLFTIASDMDLNLNRRIDRCSTEAKAAYDLFFLPNNFLGGIIRCVLDVAADFLYKTMARVATAYPQLTTCPFFGGRIYCWAITATPTTSFQRNDILVTIRSARGPQAYQDISTALPAYIGPPSLANPTSGKTHADVPNAHAAATLIPYLKAEEVLRGDMRPFAYVLSGECEDGP